MRVDPRSFGLGMWLAIGLAPAVQAAVTPADTVLTHGYVYTVDDRDSVQEAVAIQAGRIVYVGPNSGAKAYIGSATQVVDLGGRLVMPGLIDGHMHPLEGGAALLKCNLNYERLTIAQFQARVQSCLDRTRDQEPDRWLEVVNWFREAMVPNNAATTRETLDALHTKRPIFVMSSFGHTALLNSRALALAGIDAQTPDPLGGKIAHDSTGKPSGILEDAAFRRVSDELLPKPTPAEDVKAAQSALEALRQQGVTTFLDAAATSQTIAAFAGAEHNGNLTARAHFAVLITPPEGRDPVKAVAAAKALATKYDEGEAVRPHLTVRNIKLFLDGVITAPACTGALLEPYFKNVGTAANPHWVPSDSRGPSVYFPSTVLEPLLLEAARAGLEPHMHADGDGAVRAALNGIEALRRSFPGSVIRAAIAHNELVDPADFPRYKQLDAIPVLSFQWEKPAPDTIDGARDYLGPVRFEHIEPAGYLATAGARIAFGSDWPVDRLDEWFALKVAVTRENSPEAGPQFAGRLSADAGLKLPLAVRAITANAAYELHAERAVGSLEIGKLADLIVVDRNIFKVPPADIADAKVLLTLVGGKAVYRSATFQIHRGRERLTTIVRTRGEKPI